MLAGFCRSLPNEKSAGLQDHTTSPYAAPVYAKGFAGFLSPSSPKLLFKSQFAEASAKAESAVRQLAVRSLTGNPPAINICAPDAAASTAPRPAFRDDHDTPLWWDGMGANIGVIWILENRNIFWEGLDSSNHVDFAGESFF